MNRPAAIATVLLASFSGLLDSSVFIAVDKFPRKFYKWGKLEIWWKLEATRHYLPLLLLTSMFWISRLDLFNWCCMGPIVSSFSFYTNNSNSALSSLQLRIEAILSSLLWASSSFTLRSRSVFSATILSPRRLNSYKIRSSRFLSTCDSTLFRSSKKAYWPSIIASFEALVNISFYSSLTSFDRFERSLSTSSSYVAKFCYTELIVS